MSTRKKLLRRREPQDLEYQKKKLKIVLIVLMAFTVIMLLVPSDVKLPLPKNEQGTKVTQGQITSCNLLSLGSGQMYVGIQLNNKTKLLELNALRYNWNKFQSMCDKKMRIKVTYHAERLLLRPRRISYTVDLIEQLSGVHPLSGNISLYNRDEWESRSNKFMDRELIFLLPVILVLFLIGRRNEKKKRKKRSSTKLN